ncbi:hypothetical protein AB205_0185370 [Pelobates cultripes]|uniref:Ig-like domain-containing protein n=1 Tax=Pelobates cultripes TaxID=61616 RepID=A0AAD1SYC8_PELCU|nr:hypothetical protein AB205_0185370 [Pelobates cultripes]
MNRKNRQRRRSDTNSGMLLQVLLALSVGVAHCDAQGCLSYPELSLELVEHGDALLCSFCHKDLIEPKNGIVFIWRLNGNKVNNKSKQKGRYPLEHKYNNNEPWIVRCELKNYSYINAEYNMEPAQLRQRNLYKAGCTSYPLLSLELTKQGSLGTLLCSFCHKDFIQPKRDFNFIWKLNGSSVGNGARQKDRFVLDLTNQNNYGQWTCELEYNSRIRAQYDLGPPIGELDKDIASNTIPHRILVSIITVIVLILLLIVIIATATACYMMEQSRKKSAHKRKSREKRSSTGSLKETLHLETLKHDMKMDEDNVSYVELQLGPKQPSRNLATPRSTIYASIM